MMVYADEHDQELTEQILHLEGLLKRYRRMLYEMTGLGDWLTNGYPMSEYNAIVDEFEGE